MSRIVPSPPGTDASPHDEGSAPRSAWRAFLIGAVLIVLVVGGLLWGIRAFVFPRLEANSDAERQVATAQAQLSGLQTQQALTPRATPTGASAASAVTPAGATAPVAAVTPQPLATPAPTPAGAAAPGAGTEAGGGAATPLPTVPPALEAEVAEAYLHYFDVRSEALLNLDPSRLPEVAAGAALTGLEQGIEMDGAEGHAVQTDVQHDFAVLRVEGDQAVVADQYRDRSIFVDPATRQPLPGQVQPAPEEAPVVRVLYYLQRIDGVWKVIRGEREP